MAANGKRAARFCQIFPDSRSCIFRSSGALSRCEAPHSHSIVSSTCKHLKDNDFMSRLSNFTVISIVRIFRLRAIEGDRCRNAADPLLQCVPGRATSPVAHEQTLLNEATER
jgi:hypothetical protein